MLLKKIFFAFVLTIFVSSSINAEDIIVKAVVKLIKNQERLEKEVKSLRSLVNSKKIVPLNRSTEVKKISSRSQKILNEFKSKDVSPLPEPIVKNKKSSQLPRPIVKNKKSYKTETFSVVKKDAKNSETYKNLRNVVIHIENKKSRRTTLFSGILSIF